MNLATYWPEFLTIAFMHLAAVASPGPDFAIVLKHSINHGKRIAIITSVGIGSAIFLHVTYALLGIGLIINSTAWLYDGLILLASAFLIYLGFGATRSPKPVQDKDAASNLTSEIKTISDKKAFFIGFLTNGINPKATLFFLSLFTVIVDVNTPMTIKAGYGVYLAIATTVWFCCLSLMLTKSNVRALFTKNGYIFDRVMGWLLILIAFNILYSEFVAKFF
jgi:threonine/homoserine/homoserine lactone efflux protein